ncbi:phosphopantetheine-binding protein [Paenibacillus beijingensis]|uniref:phosphopantetheine-binding protein n=1 Tax=Paenibacillus beijingensis TaxID=1126833 RepID=UPI00069732D0|nr:phosphopantetheine-binding protein [Paenibacillus beijingensis]
MVTKDIITKVVQEIINNNEFDEDDDLVMYGMDSMNTIRVVVELETQLNIIFPDEELISDNFSSIKKIVAVVEKYSN